MKIFADKSDSSSPRILRASCFLAPIIAAFYMTILVSQAGGVPDNDYWSIIRSWAEADSIFDISDLYKRSNEHFVAAAKLLYAINYIVLDGDNFGLSLISILFSSTIAILLIFVASKENRNQPLLILVSVVFSVFCFTPLAAHNFFLGMSGVAWIGANLFVVIACLSFHTATVRDDHIFYVTAIVFALIAGQFYSTGITALCVLGTQGVLKTNTRRLGIYCLSAGLLYLLAFAYFQPVPNHHADRNTDPIQIFWYLVTFIGGGLSTNAQAAAALGTVGLFVGLALAIKAFAQPLSRKSTIPFWIGLMAFSVFSGGIAAVGRANMGGEVAALASRYATIPSLFWAGLLGALLASFRSSAGLRFFFTLLFLGLTVIAITSGISRLNSLQVRSQGKQLTTISLSLGIRDIELDDYLTPAFDQYKYLEDTLKRLSHVPFDDASYGCAEIGKPIPVTNDAQLEGHIDEIKGSSDIAWSSVRGWAADTSSSYPPLRSDSILRRYNCAALVTENNLVVGFATGGWQRGDVAAHLGYRRSDYGWVGYIDNTIVKRLPPKSTLNVAIPSKDGWTRLPNSIAIGPQ